MASESLISAAKLAARIQSNAYDTQISSLLDSAMLDLGLAGVEVPDSIDALVQHAAITYTVMNFRQGENYDTLKRSYDEQKAQLSMATGYTDWGFDEDDV